MRCWRRLSAIGALAYRMDSSPARMYLALSADVVRFLKHLRRHIRGPVILLWDGLNAHHGKETSAFLKANVRWLTTLRLPAYSPELNPVEGLWAWLKGRCLPNFCPEGIDPIRRHLVRGKGRLRRRPSLLRSFLRKSGLSL